MVELKIVDSTPQPENLRAVRLGEIPSLTSSYGKVATGLLRAKQSVASSLPGTRWETTDVISRRLVDEYNALMGSSGVVGQNSAPSVTVHITAFGLSTAMMAALPAVRMVHLQPGCGICRMCQSTNQCASQRAQNMRPCWHNRGNLGQFLMRPPINYCGNPAVYLSKSVVMPGAKASQSVIVQAPVMTAQWELPGYWTTLWGDFGVGINPLIEPDC